MDHGLIGRIYLSYSKGPLLAKFCRPLWVAALRDGQKSAKRRRSIYFLIRGGRLYFSSRGSCMSFNHG